jgi:outer membrane protein TolC
MDEGNVAIKKIMKPKRKKTNPRKQARISNRLYLIASIYLPAALSCFFPCAARGQATGAQEQPLKTISLEDCYKLAKQQYPLIQQSDLIDKTRNYSVENAGRGYLPQVSFNGQGTYQSAVTAIPTDGLPKPFSNINFPVLPLEQYNVHGEVDQTIYDGGIIKQTKLSDIANADIQKQNLEVQLYELKNRINQIYFGILLAVEQIKQNEIMQKDIQSAIDKTNELVHNGMALSSSVSELEAELMLQQQNELQMQSSQKAYRDMLGVFINHKIDDATVLEIPASVMPSDSIARPELSFYDYEKKGYDVQEKLLNSGNRPKLTLFFQGGNALPGLDAFNITPAWYYITGVRLSWSLGGYYTLHNQKSMLEINKQTADIQKQTFLFDTHITMKQQSALISNLQALIDKDNNIIAKRTQVKEAAYTQLQNGSITIHDYISELDSEDAAKQTLLLHQVQLLQAMYNFQNTTGNQ